MNLFQRCTQFSVAVVLNTLAEVVDDAVAVIATHRQDERETELLVVLGVECGLVEGLLVCASF